MSNPKTPTAPPVIPPPPTMAAGAAGLSDFHKQMDAALSQIVTDAPTGPVPPLSHARDDVPVVPGTPTPADLRPNAEEASLLAYRATLVDEERRLEAIRARNPMPVTAPNSQGLVPSAWGTAQSELVVREGADPLYVECFRTLRRLVAGGSPLLAMMDVPSLVKLIGALRERIEYKSPVEPVAPKKVVDG